MSILTRKDPDTSIMELSAKLVSARQELAELKTENAVLRGQLEKDPAMMWWCYAKLHRQAHALNILNRRVVSQRMVLREIERLGRGLSKDEYLAAREAIADEKLRERIEKEYTVTI